MREKLIVYILRCIDSTYFVGVTNDIERRLAEHQSGLSKKAYTFSRRPVELVWSNSFSDFNAAIQMEKKLKGWSRAKKEALINGDYEYLPGLSMNARKRSS